MTRTGEFSGGRAVGASRADALDGFDTPGAGDGASGGGFGVRAGIPAGVGLQGRHVCPFCGNVNDSIEGPCPRCTMENTADTRKATKSRIGPWYVLQSRNPAAPGMKYDTLLGFVHKGRVKARSIVRGPTTHQLWRFACQVKGLSREFGLCYSCGGSIARDAQVCPQCNRLQDAPADPDTFIEGLPPGVPTPAQVTQVAPLQPAPLQPAGPVMMPPGNGGAGFAPSAAPGAEINFARMDLPRTEPVRPVVYREVGGGPVTPGAEILFPPPSIAAAASIGPVPTTPVAAQQVPPAAPMFQPQVGAPVAPQQQPQPPVQPQARPQTPPQAQPQASVQPPSRDPSTAPAMSGGAPASAGSAGKRKANDVFLSAKDLAAAFQLDFKPDTKSARDDDALDASGPARVASLHPAQGAADGALPCPPRRRRKRRVGRTILLLLFLGICGFGASLAINPQFRQQVFDWANAKYMTLTGADLYPDIAGPGATAAPSATPRAATQRAATMPAARATTSSSSAAATPNPTPPAALTSPDLVGGAASRQPSAPQGVTPAPRQPAELEPPPQSAASRVPPAPATRPVPSPAARPVAATLPAAPKLTLQAAQQKARRWYFEALDADAEGDYATAKRIYKQIMDDLPKEIDGQEVWHSDVTLRYEQARKMLGEK